MGADRTLPRLALPALRRARLPRPPLSRSLRRQRRRPRGRPRVRGGARRGAARRRSRWRSRCRPTWPRRRSPTSAPTTSASVGWRPRSRARRSARSRSPSPTRAPTWPRSDARRYATATCGASTAARCSSPTARGRTSSRWSRRPIADGGHRGISLFIVDTSLPGVSVSRTLEKLGMHSSDTAEIALDDVAVPHADLIGLEPGPGIRAAHVAAAVRAARGRGRVRRSRRRRCSHRHDRVRARAPDVRAADRASTR